MTTESEPANRGYNIFIACLYTVAIGINVYRIADQLTDGKLSSDLSLRWTRFRGEVGYRLSGYQSERKARGQVIWEAMQTVERENET